MTNSDTDFEDRPITKVRSDGARHEIETGGAWWLYCGDDCPVVPKVGQVARFYPAGIGHRVRGLFIDGVKIWYRTEAEETDHAEIELYGADAAEWLKRWDAGRTVWSIEMGGLGPGYEQCIHITAAEILRWFLDHKCDGSLWVVEPEIWKRDRDAMEKDLFSVPVVKELELSGAQWGAAVGLASKLYMDGPRKVMNTPEIKDRHIQVSKKFPKAA